MNLKVLFVSSEVSPFAKSGGLGDVAGSLPAALKDLGVDIRVVFPKYKNIKKEYIDSAEYVSSFSLKLDWREEGGSVYKLKTDVPTYMIENSHYFERDGYYGYGDDNERFAFFSRAIFEFLNTTNFIPDIIHCNDWQSAPICLFLKDQYKRFNCFSQIRTLFTIHNLQYQGCFPKSTLNMMGLNDGYFTPDKLEFNGAVNFMKAGVLYADAVSTVSKTYSYEIQTPQYGYGLDGVLRCRQYDLYGIVNGIDYKENDPRTSKKIYVNFDENSLDKKIENKKKLQAELGLPVRPDVPMFALISRLVDQKGINLIIDAINELMSKDIQIVILGTGDARFENTFKHFDYVYKDKLSANIRFSDELAQKIYASSDFFLMPSLFEPCGLGQLFAMSYGTIPIVRTTGGLVDTVKHYNSDNKTGNGVAFHDFISSGLMWAVNEALKIYSNDEDRKAIFKNAMNTKFSWDDSAKEYIELYQKIINK